MKKSHVSKHDLTHVSYLITNLYWQKFSFISDVFNEIHFYTFNTSFHSISSERGRKPISASKYIHWLLPLYVSQRNLLQSVYLNVRSGTIDLTIQNKIYNIWKSACKMYVMYKKFHGFIIHFLCYTQSGSKCECWKIIFHH